MKNITILLILTTIISLSNTAYSSSQNCSKFSEKSVPGVLNHMNDVTYKKTVEKYILNSFDILLFSASGDSCDTASITYNCTASDLCKSFCVASTTTAGGIHVNTAYTLNTCHKKVKLTDSSID